MGLFGKKKLEKGQILQADAPFARPLSWYWEAFSDDRLSYDDWVSMTFHDPNSHTVDIRPWNGEVELYTTPNGTRPAFKFHVSGAGIRYGELMDFIEAQAQEDGWDAPRIFRCVYDDEGNMLSPQYASVEKDPETPGHYIVTAEGWTDTGGPWFEAPPVGVWGL